ncbi:MAG: DUF4142 domain-containing protein [Alphaproteobacteria bacterium]|nr:DUF4142 domain-containing protein [Alphaproteobacteria bacterium]
MTFLKSAVFAAVTTAAAMTAPSCFAQTAAMPLTAADYNFIAQAAFGGWGEVSLGQVAQQRSGNPAITRLGAMLAADHMRANQELASLAMAHGVTPPNTPDPGRQGVATMLQAMSGPMFDREFVMEQIADHQVSITLFQGEAQMSMDPALRGFAQRYVPVLQQHLQALMAANNVAMAR